jgi:predicted nucleic acid-binding protein
MSVVLASAFYSQHHADKRWTRTDCASFLIMRERKSTGALTGDRHFEQAGFAPLLI